MHRPSRIWLGATFALWAALLPKAVLAEDVSEPAWKFHSGFTIGFAFGLGASSACEGCSRPLGLGFDGAAGLFVKPRVALLYDVFAVTTAEAEDVVSTGTALQSFAVQYWISPSFWIKGGIGAARFLRATPLGAEETTGGGMTLGAGYELFRGDGNFALNFEGRLSQCDIGQTEITSFGVLFGLNWY